MIHNKKYTTLYKLKQVSWMLSFMLRNLDSYGIRGTVWTIKHYWKTTKQNG